MDTHFGFKKVSEDEKTHLVKDVFNRVANKYDIMNDVMSLSFHRLWKKMFIERMMIHAHAHVLDLAGGTGDIAKLIYLKSQKYSLDTQITICDINQDMLDVGKAKLIDEGILSGIEFVCGDAEQLPFDDNTFDHVTISFGLRNVTHIDKALSEIFRVLKPNGQFLCLEFSQVQRTSLKCLYDFYSFSIIPKIGQFITGQKDAYDYLVESIRQFPPQDELLSMMKTAGFTNCHFENIMEGVVAIHQGWKK